MAVLFGLAAELFLRVVVGVSALSGGTDADSDTIPPAVSVIVMAPAPGTMDQPSVGSLAMPHDSGW